MKKYQILAFLAFFVLFGCYSSKTTQKSSSDSSFVSKSSEKVDSTQKTEEIINSTKKTTEKFDIEVESPKIEISTESELKNGKSVFVFSGDTIETNYDEKSNILATKVKIGKKIIKKSGERVIDEKRSEILKKQSAVSSQETKGTESYKSTSNKEIEKKGILTDWRLCVFSFLFLLVLLVVWLVYRNWNKITKL